MAALHARLQRADSGVGEDFCPIPGRNLRSSVRSVHAAQVNVDPRLVRHVQDSSGLDVAEATRLIQDVLAFHDETVEEWVRRRHAELRAHGSRNEAIFARLREELPTTVVAAPELSERQLRRIIYG